MFAEWIGKVVLLKELCFRSFEFIFVRELEKALISFLMLPVVMVVMVVVLVTRR